MLKLPSANALPGHEILTTTRILTQDYQQPSINQGAELYVSFENCSKQHLLPFVFQKLFQVNELEVDLS